MSQPPTHVIAEPYLAEWVEGLLSEGEVIGPRAGHGNDVAYDVVTAPEEVAWDYAASSTPLKQFLFPQVDSLLRWERGDTGELRVEPTVDETERIFLAVRPCDVSGVSFLDRVFSRDRQDTYYLSRRQRSTFIALACDQPGENCFCVCADSGPFLDAGYDLQLTRLSGEYLVEVGSQRGADLVGRSNGMFAPASQALLQAREAAARAAEERFGDHKAYFAAALRTVTFDRVPEVVWEEMAERCLECGGCSFICPTCSCFLTADRQRGTSGERDRIWDSCVYECHAREASGHNPRAARKDRLKARFFHKLSHQFAKPLETHGCVGCGRCVTACLGGNDMPSVTAKIRRGAL